MKPPPISEAAFQRSVIELAHRFNWRVAHFHTSMNARGQYMTAVSGDGAGFPDLVLSRDRVVFVELKAEKGTLSDNQLDWQDSLRAAGAEYYCWKPSDWARLEAQLKRRERAAA